MKQSFVQCAEIVLEADGDPAAPGGAVTIALCGSWDHDGPCRWPHHTSAAWDEERGRVRVVFAVEAEDEMRVRGLIEWAIKGGECTGPGGKVSRWETLSCSAGVLAGDEVELAARIAAMPEK